MSSIEIATKNSIQYFFVMIPRLLVNWKTPFGYLIEFFIQCGATYSVLFSTVTATCHLIGSCWIIVEFVRDISNELIELNDNTKSEHIECELKERLINIIQLHTDVNQLSGTRVNI